MANLTGTVTQPPAGAGIAASIRNCGSTPPLAGVTPMCGLSGTNGSTSPKPSCTIKNASAADRMPEPSTSPTTRGSVQACAANPLASSNAVCTTRKASAAAWTPLPSVSPRYTALCTATSPNAARAPPLTNTFSSRSVCDAPYDASFGTRTVSRTTSRSVPASAVVPAAVIRATPVVPVFRVTAQSPGTPCANAAAVMLSKLGSYSRSRLSEVTPGAASSRIGSPAARLGMFTGWPAPRAKSGRLTVTVPADRCATVNVVRKLSPATPSESPSSSRPAASRKRVGPLNRVTVYASGSSSPPDLTKVICRRSALATSDPRTGPRVAPTTITSAAPSVCSAPSNRFKALTSTGALNVATKPLAVRTTPGTKGTRNSVNASAAAE